MKDKGSGAWHSFREWMHGKGRNIIILAIVVGAICMIANYRIVWHGGDPFYKQSDVKATMTPTPEPIDQTIVGGDSLKAAPTGTPVVEDTEPPAAK